MCGLVSGYVTDTEGNRVTLRGYPKAGIGTVAQHFHPFDVGNAGLFCRSLQPFQWLLCQKNEKLPSSYKQFFGGQFDLIQVAFMAIRNWHF